jgi:hypothetical protein
MSENAAGRNKTKVRTAKPVHRPARVGSDRYSLVSQGSRTNRSFCAEEKLVSDRAALDVADTPADAWRYNSNSALGSASFDTIASHFEFAMTTNNTDNDLRGALETFETSLATPIVSGELTVWSDHVRAAWTRLLPLVRKQLTKLHPKQYDEITGQDPELFAQIDKLKAEDAALDECSRGLDQTTERVAKLAPLVEPDERKFSEHMAHLQKHGTEFVARVRKQQVAVQTWYQEAFVRDRGVAD